MSMKLVYMQSRHRYMPVLQQQLKKEGSDRWNLVGLVIFVGGQFLRGVSLLDENVVQQHFDEVRLRSGSSPKAQLRDNFHKELTTTLFDFLDLILVHMVIFKSFFHTVQL